MASHASGLDFVKITDDSLIPWALKELDAQLYCLRKVQ